MTDIGLIGVGYARDVARENGTVLPLNGVVHEAYEAAIRCTGDDEAHASALIKYWLALTSAEGRYE